MSLFQKSVVNKYFNNLNPVAVEEAYKQFIQFFGDAERIENIRLLKEENYQEGFLREIFVDVLGYTINPNKNYNLTTEFKNLTDSKKADGAVLLDDKAIGVIELKSTTTPNLESIRDQAFNYKNNQPDCRFVITSNFEKLRFYIDNATDWEEFNLFNLDFENFRRFYLYLSKESIFNGITIKLKDESKLHEEDITGKLYNDYSVFKHQLFNDLIKLNPQQDKLLLFHKSQKLLDRILFVLFAEDRGLIPPNAITRIIDQWKTLKDLDEEKSLYSRFVKLFHHLDEGHKYKEYELPAYNGGLFKKDAVLDSLIITDNILNTNTIKLSTYDYNTEVDVNILGHIFENSITEIEQVKAEIEGEQTDKNRSRRKKEGIFYTPKYITKYIVDNTIGALCNGKKKELGIDEIENEIIENSRTSKGKLSKKAEALLKNLDDYRTYLLSLKILDPACGSGAFLNQALEFLINEHELIDSYRRELEQDSLGLYDTTKSILENNLYGVDINEEAVEIAKLSLWIRTAERGRKLSDLNYNIKCGNSLIDDPAVAGDKAFNWNKEFPEIMKAGGFDVVIGNPPYGAAFNDADKFFLRNKFEKSATGKIDSYRIFIEQAFVLCNTTGVISLIVPNTFLYNVQSFELRKHIFETVEIYDAVELRKNIFEDAPDIVPAIISFRNQTLKSYTFRARVAFHNIKYNDIDNSIWESDQIVNSDFLEKTKNLKINLRNNVQFDSINQKLSKHRLLGDFFNLRQGTKPYGNKNIKDIELISKTQKGIDWEKAINGRNISRYFIEFENDYVLRCDKLHSVIEKEIVNSEKIYFQRMRKISLFPRIVACYDSNSYHGLYTCSVISRKPETALSLKYTLGIINSKLINLWYKYFDTDIEIKLTSVKQINIPELSEFAQQPLIDKVDVLLDITSKFELMRSSFISLLSSKLNFATLSNKLKNWYELEYSNFLIELKKKDIRLSLNEAAEWMQYFNEQKEKVQALKSEIDKTDKEIDQLVYQLYGLTEEEIKIVEGTK